MKRILSPHLLGLFPNANAGPRIQRYGDMTGYWDIHTSSSSSWLYSGETSCHPAQLWAVWRCYVTLPNMPDYHQQESLIQGSPALFLLTFLILLIIIHHSFLCILQFGWYRLSIVSTQNGETLIFINIVEYKGFKVLKLWLEFKLATCWKHFLISPFYRSVGAASASIRYPGNYRQMLGLNTLIGRWRQCF